MNSLDSTSDPALPTAAELEPTPLTETALAALVSSPDSTSQPGDLTQPSSRKDKDRDKVKENPSKEKDPRREEQKARKKQKKEKAEIRTLAPWERYKALHDAVKESQDLVDLADHKARFALIIMGALNAAIIILGARSDLISTLPPDLKIWLYGYFAVYAAIAVYFLVQAIETLRPRSIPDISRKGHISDREESLGLRFFVDALRYDPPTYLKAWQSVRVSQLNTELATQLYTLARINKAKYRAVAKLYVGLQGITFLTAAFLIALGVRGWIDHRAEVETASHAVGENLTTPPKLKAGKPKKGGWAILGEPERFSVQGVKEPSGIVFSPTRGTFFVVGDEGSLVEVSKDGKVLAQIPTGGNLEDVALHAPSGRLVLLSEKKGELVILDPGTGKKTGKFKLDDVALLGEAAVDKNQGFEGVVFREEAGRPGGGIFYLVHQRAPAMLIAIAFDPLAPSASLGAQALVSRSAFANREDLTAVTYDASLNRLFVIADSKDRLVMIKHSGEEETEIVLPGVQQEGLAFDLDGNLWIADDKAGLLVFRGARGKIEAEMKLPHPDPTPTVNPS